MSPCCYTPVRVNRQRQVFSEISMFQREAHPRIPVAAYLEIERDGSVKHEYVDGQVYAMAGASDRHNRIALRLAARLDAHLGDDDACEVFMADMKVRVAPHLFYYPDVAITCDPPGGDPYFRSQPRVVVEIVSPTTERIDRHEKRLSYTQVPSLAEYVLIEQDRMRVEVVRREDEGAWSQTVLSRPGDVLELRAVDFRMSLAEVYRGVQLNG